MTAPEDAIRARRRLTNKIIAAHDATRLKPFLDPQVKLIVGDGSLIRVIGDAIWWKLLENSGRNLIRLPLIIGHYRSDPASQAEFRTPADGEFGKFDAVGVALK